MRSECTRARPLDAKDSLTLVKCSLSCHHSPGSFDTTQGSRHEWDCSALEVPGCCLCSCQSNAFDFQIKFWNINVAVPAE